MSIYTQNIIEHYKNPQNKYVMKNSDISLENINRSCWDQVKVYLKIKNNIVNKISYDWDWCSISVSACSMLSEELIWMTITEIMELSLVDVQGMLWVSVWANRIKCALLCLDTIKSSLSSYAS